MMQISGVTDDYGDEEIRCSPRAYFLYLLEYTLFMDKITSRVLVGYLHC